MSSEPELRAHHAPPWLFGITNLPFGIAGGYAAVAMPFLLAGQNVAVKPIAEIASVVLWPAALQWATAPILDLGIRRREWLVLMSVLGAICLGASNLIPMPQPQIPMLVDHLPVIYILLVVAGQAMCGLVGSCNGALVSVTLPTHLKPRAAGWVNAANLGGATLGGGVVMTLSDDSAFTKLASSDFVTHYMPSMKGLFLTLAGHCSVQTAGIALFVMILLPALTAFLLPEPVPDRDPLLHHLSAMGRDLWKAVSARKGWTGLLFCISPVGTVALNNVFSALGDDFNAHKTTVELVTGYAGGFITAVSCLAAAYLVERMNFRVAYILSGILTGVVALVMSLVPANETTYTVGCVAYMIVTGLAYTAFSTVVYEIVGMAGKTAATLYSVFPAVGNLAIAYTIWLDGIGHDWRGVRGMLWMDTGLNLAGVAFLLTLIYVMKGRTEAEVEGPEVTPPLADVVVG